MRTQPVAQVRAGRAHPVLRRRASALPRSPRLAAQPDIDFLDGVVFAPDEMVVSVGRFVDEAPYVSDYSFEHIYYRSLRERPTDFLTARGLSVALGHRLVLVLEERRRAASAAAASVRPQAAELGDLPAHHALEQPVGTYPRAEPNSGRTCRIGDPGRRHSDRPRSGVPGVPARRGRHSADLAVPDPGAGSQRAAFTLYPLTPGRMYVNFGFWDVVTTREQRPRGLLQSADRAQGARARRNQVALLGLVFHRRRVLGDLQPSGVRGAQGKIRPAGVLGDLYAKTVLRA